MLTFAVGGKRGAGKDVCVEYPVREVYKKVMADGGICAVETAFRTGRLVCCGDARDSKVRVEAAGACI